MTDAHEARATLPSATLALPIRGSHLRGATLAEELGDDPTLLCFLRHFG